MFFEKIDLFSVKSTIHVYVVHVVIVNLNSNCKNSFPYLGKI